MTDVAPVGRPQQWMYLAAAAFVVVFWFATLPSRPLFNPDEGRYAEIPREMLNGGDWVIPHLNGVAYVEKPPLQYWATAISLAVFGQNEFAARFYTAFCAVGTLIVIWSIAARTWGTAAAWRASAILAGLMLFVIMGQLLSLDMSLTFFMTAAMAAFLAAQGDGQPVGADNVAAKRWMLLAWAATACGVLTKGLVAAVIPAAVLVLYSVYARDFAPWRRLNVALGLPLFLGLTVPWHWLAAKRLPDFLQFFFVHEHVSRYLTPSADREAPWWFFAAVFALGTIPWTVAALRVVTLGWQRRASRRQFDPALFLWIWSVFIGVFFSLSDSKLIPYILPAIPAVALLIGASPAKSLRRDVGLAALFTVLVGLALAVASQVAPRYVDASARNVYFLMLAKPLLPIAALLSLSGALVLFQRHRDLTRAAVLLGVGWCLAGMLLMRAAGAVAPVYSGIGLARALGAVARDEPLYSVATYDQTLPFYAQRTVRLVAYRGELDFGLRHDPRAEIADVGDFIGQWQGLAHGYAIMEIGMFEDLRARDVPMREIARDVRRVLVARR